MDTGYAHARYRELLYQHGHGYPFWIPEPSDALPEEMRAQGMRLGDVGVLTDDGGFEYLWNVHLPAEHAFNKSRVPPNFTPMDPLNESRDVRKINDFYPANTVISSESIKKRKIGLEGAIEPAIVGGIVSGGVGFEFSAEGNSGAILLLPQGGMRVDALKRDLYQKYAARHAESWYRYINQDLQLGIQSGALYLVTGTDKCSSWGLASFSKPSGSRGFTLKFLVSGAASSDVSVKSSWSVDFGVAHRTKVVDPSQKSQCVFARGFVISVRTRLWAQICGATVKTTSLYGAHGRPSFIGSSRPYTRNMESGLDVEIQPIPNNPLQKSPAALIGDELLEQNDDASFAIVHDDDWIIPTQRGDLVQTRAVEGSFLARLVSLAASRTNAIVVDGICTVADEEPATPSYTVLANSFKSISNAAAAPLSRDRVPIDLVASALLYIQQHVALQPAQAKAQTGVEQPEIVRVSSKPRLFALLIGINEYEHAGSVFQNLKGAVADADDMFEFLTATLGVDPSHIRNLRDRQATRRGIIDAFSALAGDKRIQSGDAIVIYYAGHGSQTAAPSGWEAGARDARIEMIIPHNFLPATTSNVEQQGILDITLAKLLSTLAQRKGDNITVIFDSCHSGSSTRNPLELDLQSRGFTLPDNYAVLPSLMEQDGKRQAKVAAGYEFSGLASHALLAACSRTESAQECRGRGFFTQALLELLRSENLRNMTYRGIIERLPDLPRQHPQCEGKNSTHVLFDGKAPDRRCVLYPVKVTRCPGEGTAVTLGGGEVHGVTEGAEFDVFATRDSNAPPLCRLITTTTNACSANLAVVAGSIDDIPQPAWALQATAGKRADLAVAVYPIREFLDVLQIAVEMNMRPKKRTIRFVDRDQPHELELQADGKDAFFHITDKLSTAAGLTKLPTSVPLDDAAAIYAVVEAAADFFFHLRRSNASAPLDGKIILEAFELEDRYDSKEGSFNISPCGQNLVEGGVMQLEITEDEPMYGFKLVSGYPLDLYVWVFVFDLSDFSIEPVYKPNFSKTRPDPSLLARGSLTLGYGSGGVEPFQFFLPEGNDVDVAYLKVFVTSEPVDLSHVAQKSPFEAGNSRRRKSRDEPQLPVWDTVLVAIVQKAASE